MRKPALSLILCSRNDQYMGNSLWRLQTTLNYVAQNIHELARDEDVEVLVADWGSEIPLREVLELSPAAARIVSFTLIPPELARDLQKDSPFPEVLALNAAARRASGEYIGRIDQDTLVGKQFLEFFFELCEGSQRLEVPLESALLFANQRMFPYRVVIRNPSFWIVDKYIHRFGRFMKIEISPVYSNVFYKQSVGIWLVHRNLWNECGGYDERLIYMNAMEINMIDRLKEKYVVVDLGHLVNYAFFHLEHYHPLVPRSSSTHRKINPEAIFAKHDILNPTGSDWGLAQYHFEKLPYPLKNKVIITTLSWSPFGWLVFLHLMITTGVQIAVDEIVRSFRLVVKSFRTVNAIWRRRANIVLETVHSHPLVTWPRLLITYRIERKALTDKKGTKPLKGFRE